MKRNNSQRQWWNSVKSYWLWKKSNAVVSGNDKNKSHLPDGVVTIGGGKKGGEGNIIDKKTGLKEKISSSLSSSSSSSYFSPFSHSSPSPLDSMKDIVHTRRSCKRFDPTRPVNLDVVADLLAATVRAPTGLNLQPWVAVVVHDEAQRGELSRAALGQPQPREAPVTVVFAGDTEPERNAPAALEAGLESGYYHAAYGAGYLRHAYYLLHGGPLNSMAHVKSFVSAWYSEQTGTPLLSVPTNKQAYAWKQAMIPATTFMYLATAAGFDTAVLEGFDEAQVRRVVGLPARFTVPVIISVGHGAEKGFHSVRSPRFSTQHLVRWGKY